MLALLIVALLSGCDGAYSILDPASTSAAIAASFWWGMFIWFTLVLVAVVVLWLYAMARKGRPQQDATAVRQGRRWILGGGIILPLVSIAVLMAFGLPLGHRTLPAKESPTMGIQVVGHQWWWEVRYPDAGVITANQLHIPAGEPVNIHVTGEEVIHAFWVPRLAGKIDMIPGHINVIQLEAEEPGLYHGHCSEFCGLLHAHMAFTVRAHTREEFEAWLRARQAPTKLGPAEHGIAADFQKYCGRCHRVAGVSSGTEGPDLSDVGSRDSLGAGTIPLEDGAILRWLNDHQSLKPGNLMPEHKGRVPPETLEAIAEWLETLDP